MYFTYSLSLSFSLSLSLPLSLFLSLSLSIPYNYDLKHYDSNPNCNFMRSQNFLHSYRRYYWCPQKCEIIMVPSNYSFFQYCDNNICLFASFSYRSSDVVTAIDVALNLYFFIFLFFIAYSYRQRFH